MSNRPKPRFIVALIGLLAGFSAYAQFTEITDNVEPWWGGSSSSFNVSQIKQFNGLWALGYESGLVTTTDFLGFTDRSSALASYSNITSIDTDEDATAVWAIGTDFGELKTTTDFVNFTDRTSALGFQNLPIASIENDEKATATWAIVGYSHQFKTTTDFVNFSDRTTAAGIFSCLFGENNSWTVIATDGDKWVLGGECSQLKTTEDFVNFSDRTTAAGFFNPPPLLDPEQTISAIAKGGVWAIASQQGLLKTTTDFINFTERSTAAGGNLGYIFNITYSGSVWAISTATKRLLTTTDFINFSDRTTALDFGNQAILGIDVATGSNPLWAMGGTGTNLKTTQNTGSTTEFIHFLDRERNLAVGGTAYAAAQSLSGVWAIGGNDGELHTSTNLANFSDRTSQLGFTNNILSIESKLPSGASGWVVGGSAGKIKSASSAFAEATDRTSQFGFASDASVYAIKWGLVNTTATLVVGGGGPGGGTLKSTATDAFDVISDHTTAGGFTTRGVSAIAYDPYQTPPLWAIGGASGTLKTTTNFVNFSDRRIAAGFGSLAVGVIKPYYYAASPTDGTTWWAIGSTSGRLKTTENFINFSDRTTALGFGTSTVRSIEVLNGSNSKGVWLIAGDGGKLKTTTDFINFTDRSTDALFRLANSTIYAIAHDTEDTFILVGDSHRVVKNDATALAVELVNFEARAFSGEVQLYWETGSEINNVGFNIYRSRTGDTSWTLLTSIPIQGLNTSATGGKYIFRDLDAENGVLYHYYLEDIDFFTGGTLHGPVSARPADSLGTPTELSSAEQATYAAIAFSSQFTSLSSPPTSSSSSPASGTETRVSIRSTSSSRTELEIWIPAGLVSHDAILGDRVDVSGFGQLNLPNRPVVPYRGIVLQTPCRSVSNFDVQSLTEDALSNINLEIGGVTEVRDAEGNVVEPWGDGVDPLSATTTETPGHWATDDGIYPSAYASLGAVRCSGDGKGIATLSVTPIQVTVGSNEVKQARHLLVRVEWGSALEGESGPTTEPIQQSLAEDNSSAKLAITHSGIYRLSSADLSSLGFASIPLSDLRLFSAGVPLPFSVVNSGIEYYAQHRPTKQSPETIVWLSANRSLPTKSGESALLTNAVTSTALWTTAHAETNRLYITSLPGDESIDRFIWDAIYWAPTFVIQPTFSIPLSNVDTSASADARLRVRLVTATDVPGVSPDHHIKVFWNGSEVDDFTSDGVSHVTREILLSHSSLLNGNNTLQLREVGDLSSKMVITYFDWAEVEFVRTPAWDGALPLQVRANSTGLATLSGLPPSTSVSLWNVSDPLLPKRVMGAQSEPSGVLAWNAKAGQDYILAISPESVTRSTRNRRSTLRSDSPTAALYISHRDLLPAAERLATYRRALKSVTVVDVEDIYDEYGDGAPSDLAITAFIQDWKARKGEQFSVLLFGDATADPHDYLGKGFRNYVPTHLHWIRYFETASDALLMNGDDNPRTSIRVGRIPVTTLAEADRIVDRIIAFEASDPDDDWMKKITLVSDEPKQAWEVDFEHFSTNVSEALPTPFVGEVELLRVLGASALRTEIIDSLNYGTLFFNFFGHGAYNFMAQSQVFKASDLSQLDNLDTLPIVTALNCLNGYFVATSVDTLAEGMLKGTNGGAVAYLSSSGLNDIAPLQLFGEGFYRSVTTEAPASLGSAFVKEKLRTLNANGEDLYDTLHLFGDPDMRIPGISPPPSSSVGSGGIIDLSTTGDGPTTLNVGGEPPAAESNGCGRTSSADFAWIILGLGLALVARRRRAVLSPLQR